MMKSQLAFLAMVLVLPALLIPSHVSAQAAGGAQGGRLGFLSADDRAHLMRVRQQVLASNPELKSEQESLEKEEASAKGMTSTATDEDKQTLREKMMAHHEKMDAAMKAADPTVAPILDQVNAKMKARFQQHAGQGGDGGAAN